eukprot:jgi/Ulvmu1/5391/UM022_0186.1
MHHNTVSRNSVARSVSRLLPRRKGPIAQAAAEQAMDWASLQAQVEQAKQAAGIQEVADPANGPTNPNVHKRLFGKSDADVRVHLYRDHAAWCPYCQRIWWLLEEKRIPYTMEKINMRSYGDKPRSFLDKVPNGLLPVIELDGRVYTESMDIMMLLEKAFPERRMLPPAPPLQPLLAAGAAAVRSTTARLTDTPEFTEVGMLPGEGRLREAAGALLQLERDVFALWCRWLFRPLDDAGEQRARAAFCKAMDSVDSALAAIGGGGPFFLGEELSMVDIVWAPFLERQNASLLFWKGFKLRNGGWDNIDRWFEALEARSTYSATQSDYYTHCYDIPPQYGTCWPAPNTEDIACAINGTDGRSWKLPLPPITADSQEPRTNVVEGGLAERYRVEAAAKLASNRSAVAKFALRAVGSPGKHFSAPLADPNAKPDLSFVQPVEAALACTVHALLHGTESAQEVFGDGAWLGGDRAKHAEVVEKSLGYLRDRVGVPRDMQFAAARQLRAHLNFTIDLANEVAGAAA